MRRLLYRMKYLLLGGLTWVVCYLLCFRYEVFGAKVDWISQHSVLPDYFRQQFYETGNLFPEFAANIGGGQNIYNFAYYGLYNPLLLPSYLLPFVKMADYMMAIQLAGLTASVLLLCSWLEERGFSGKICVGVSVLFLLSGPMIFHSCKQIMFVNYMPFLLMGLMGVDRYFRKEPENCRRGTRRGGMLTVSIFLMIMTSFYFSIGGMLVLVLYGIHRWLTVCEEGSKKITVKAFLTEGIRFAFCFIMAVMMSGILIVPAAFALMGRKGEGAAVCLGKLLTPEVSMTRFCYSPYGIGLTTLAVTALIALLCGRKMHERVLAVCCAAVLAVPVFSYLLNGGLYVRDKVMIPFLPLLCYILAYYLNGLEGAWGEATQRKAVWKRVLPYVLTVGLIYIGRRQGNDGKYWKFLMLDGIVMLVCFLLFIFCRRRTVLGSADVAKSRRGRQFWCSSLILLIPAILMMAEFDYECHRQADMLLDQKFYNEVTDSDIGEEISRVTEKEKGFYRTEQLGNNDENAANLNRIWDTRQYVSSIYSSSYHEGYRKFREETFQLEEPFRNFLMQSAVHNPVYQRFMGVKYIVAKEGIPGYKEVKSTESYGGSQKETEGDIKRWKVYENKQVSPVAYGTDRVISEKTYRELEFPYNQLALLEYAVVKDTAGLQSVGNDTASLDIDKGVKQIRLELPETIDSDADKKIMADLPDPKSGKGEMEGERVLFLRFQIENQKPLRDVAVWVDGIRNKLTAGNHFYYNKNTEFTYAVPLKDGQDTVEMVFGKGRYAIKNAEAYIGILPKSQLYQSEFRADWERTKGNRIEGSIVREKPGYFITTIPYDENFEIQVDGEQVETEEVNTAFLGFWLGAGRHEVHMVYHAPGVKAGKMMSLAGLVMACGAVFCQRRSDYTKRREQSLDGGLSVRQLSREAMKYSKNM